MTVSPDWTPPPPPEASGRRPIRPGLLWIGVGIALGGHLLTILIGWLVALNVSGEAPVNFLYVAGIGQVVLAVAALAYGITATVRARDGGIGVGIIIGWAIGLIISPVVGFGVCISLVDGNGTFG